MDTPDLPRDSDCAGFYLWPPIWVGTPPVEHGAELTPAILNAEVFAGDFACGVRLKVSKQGLFVFDFAQWEPGSAMLAKHPLKDWEERVFARMRFMNLFLTCFYTSQYRIQRWTSEKIFIDYMTYIAARTFELNPGHIVCDMRQAYVIRAAEEEHVKFKPVFNTISEDVLKTAMEMTDIAIAKDAATIAELLLHSFYLHQSGKYEASHITAWTIVERCLNAQWLTHLHDLDNKHAATGAENKFISKTRADKLTNHDFTASIISEILSLFGILPFDKYNLVSSARVKRNKWVHNLDTIGRSDAAKVIMLAQFMLRDTGIFDVEISFNQLEGIPIAWVTE
jgi:hypothetical protein